MYTGSRENESCSVLWSRQLTIRVSDTFIYFPAQEEKCPPQQLQYLTVPKLLLRHKAPLKAGGLWSLEINHLRFGSVWSLVKESVVPQWVFLVFSHNCVCFVCAEPYFHLHCS